MSYLTKREIFDKVRSHLLTQGARAMDGSKCVYRNDDGLKCAVGCLIPDSLYSPVLEGLSVTAALDGTIETHERFASILEKAGINTSDSSTIDLLAILQSIHDGTHRDITPDGWNEIEAWKRELKILEDRHFCEGGS